MEGGGEGARPGEAVRRRRTCCTRKAAVTSSRDEAERGMPRRSAGVGEGVRSGMGTPKPWRVSLNEKDAERPAFDEDEEEDTEAVSS